MVWSKFKFGLFCDHSSFLLGGCDGGNACCSSTNKCGAGEGDCDNDHDCQGSMVCGQDNCPSTGHFDTTDDCCKAAPTGKWIAYLLNLYNDIDCPRTYPHPSEAQVKATTSLLCQRKCVGTQHCTAVTWGRDGSKRICIMRACGYPPTYPTGPRKKSFVSLAMEKPTFLEKPYHWSHPCGPNAVMLGGRRGLEEGQTLPFFPGTQNVGACNQINQTLCGFLYSHSTGDCFPYKECHPNDKSNKDGDEVFCSRKPCPVGYEHYHGIFHEDTWGTSGFEKSLKHCKKRCDMFLKCCSFEWNMFQVQGPRGLGFTQKGLYTRNQGWCKLNKECKPNLRIHGLPFLQNRLFCAKKQQEIGLLQAKFNTGCIKKRGMM